MLFSSNKPHTKNFLYVRACVCVRVHTFLMIILKCVHSHHDRVFSSPMMPSLLIVEMMLKCTEYLLIRLSCSVTGRINQSRGQLCTYIFQAHLRTSGYEITVLSSQIWSTNAVPLCHSNLRWRCYYVELSKVIKTVQRSSARPGWTLLTAFIYWGGDVPFFQDYKSYLDLKKIMLCIHWWPPNIPFPHLTLKSSRKKPHRLSVTLQAKSFNKEGSI